MARAAIPFLGDVCVVDLLEDGGVRRFVAAADPAHGRRRQRPRGVARASRRRTTPSRRRCARPARSCATWTRPGSRTLPRTSGTRSVIAASGVRRFLIVPLLGRERAIGALTFGDARRRSARYEEADVTVAEVLAQRAAKAMENARLHRQVRQLASHERARRASWSRSSRPSARASWCSARTAACMSANAAAERFLGGPVPDLPTHPLRASAPAPPGSTRPGAGVRARRSSSWRARAGTWVEVSAYPTGGDAAAETARRSRRPRARAAACWSSAT